MGPHLLLRGRSGIAVEQGTIMKSVYLSVAGEGSICPGSLAFAHFIDAIGKMLAGWGNSILAVMPAKKYGTKSPDGTEAGTRMDSKTASGGKRPPRRPRSVKIGLMRYVPGYKGYVGHLVMVERVQIEILQEARKDLAKALELEGLVSRFVQKSSSEDDDQNPSRLPDEYDLLKMKDRFDIEHEPDSNLAKIYDTWQNAKLS
jgi:hypothetical protein